jgi:hypothetical protein
VHARADEDVADALVVEDRDKLCRDCLHTGNRSSRDRNPVSSAWARMP